MSVSLTLLGTGTPKPLSHRAGSSYLVTLDDDALLVDCGPGAMQRLLAQGTPATRISTLFLTHLHYDHCVDLAYLVLSRWDQGGGAVPELRIVGPPGTRRMVDTLFGPNGAFDPDLTARTQHPGSHFIFEQRGGVLPRKRPMPEVIEVIDGSELDGGHWRLRVAEVIHVQPYLTCLAYRIEAEDRSMVFGGDTAPIESLIELARDADVLLHMCHFLNGVTTDSRITACCSGHLDAARTARDAGVQTLVLVHITAQIDRPVMREKVLVEIGRRFDGEVVLGGDLLEIPLGGVQPGLDLDREA